METGSIAAWKVKVGPMPGLERLNLQATGLDDGTQQLPGGGYTTFRTYGGTRAAHLEDHFRRLEESARLLSKPLTVERAPLRAALRQALADYPAPERRVRLLLDLEREPGVLYILIEPLHVPSEAEYARGVKAITRRMHRENPKAKQTAFIETAARVRRELPPGVNEVLMVGEDGRVLEGLSSNFFAVLDGVIWTADEGVLSGITREGVLACIRKAGIPLRMEGIACADLRRAGEAFITSASRAVLPVTEIDGRPVGDGRPGALTLNLLREYRAWVEGELEEI